MKSMIFFLELKKSNKLQEEDFFKVISFWTSFKILFTYLRLGILARWPVFCGAHPIVRKATAWMAVLLVHGILMNITASTRTTFSEDSIGWCAGANVEKFGELAWGELVLTLFLTNTVQLEYGADTNLYFIGNCEKFLVNFGVMVRWILVLEYLIGPSVCVFS